MSARRFPPPWTVEELDGCFVVVVARRAGHWRRKPIPLLLLRLVKPKPAQHFLGCQGARLRQFRAAGDNVPDAAVGDGAPCHRIGFDHPSCAENGFFDAQPSTDAFNRFGNHGVDLIVVHTTLPFRLERVVRALAPSSTMRRFVRERPQRSDIEDFKHEPRR